MIYICSTQAKKAVDSNHHLMALRRDNRRLPQPSHVRASDRFVSASALHVYPQNDSGGESTKSTHSGVKPSMTSVCLYPMMIL